MPDTPHDSDDTDESNDTDGESSEIVIDDGEVAAEFLEDRSPEEYPAVLRITSESSETHRREALDRLDLTQIKSWTFENEPPTQQSQVDDS